MRLMNKTDSVMKLSILTYLPIVAGLIGGIAGGYIHKKTCAMKHSDDRS